MAISDNPAALVCEELKIDVATSLKDNNRYATGKTEASLEVIETGPNGAQLLGAGYIDALELGRKPTSEGAPKGNPSLFEAIQEWCAAKGIDQKAAYPITQSIHKKGYKGKPGVLSKPLSDENINSIMDKHLQNVADLFEADVLAALGG